MDFIKWGKAVPNTNAPTNQPKTAPNFSLKWSAAPMASIRSGITALPANQSDVQRNCDTTMVGNTNLFNAIAVLAKPI